MVSKKQSPPPPAPPEPVEESSGEEVKEEDEEEELNAEEESDEDQVENPSSPLAEETISGSEQKETESEEEEDDEEPESNNEESESPIPSNTKTSKSTSKRLLKSSKNDVKRSRNQKRAKSTIKENNKKGKITPCTPRVWSHHHEIVLLQGMIDYRKENGHIPFNDLGVFHKFIKGKLWEGVMKRQITDKLNNLKGKYLLKFEQSMKNKEDPTFLNPFEKNIFKLCKQIWGGGIEIETEIEIIKGVDNEIITKFPTLIKYSDEELGFLKDNMHFIVTENAVELENKWKQLQMEDMDGLAKRLNMRSEQIKLVLDAMKKKKKQQ